MKILIANPGSTSYKCKLYDTEDNSILFQATIERIGDNEGIYTFQHFGQNKITSHLSIPDYFTAVNLTINSLKETIFLDDISAVGFKTVLAKGISGCVELTDTVIKDLEKFQKVTKVNENYLSSLIKHIKESHGMR